MNKIVLILLLVLDLSFAETMPDIITQNGCTACHNIMGPKTAPAFKGIARRASRMYGSSAHKSLKESIRKGSSGKYRRFTGVTMPPYAHFSESDLDIISNWILSLDDGLRGRGKGRGAGNGMRSF